MSHSEIEVGGGARLIVRGIDEHGSVANVDLELIDSHGARWSATVLTVGEIQRLMHGYRTTGECGGGAYFRVPDLLIIDDPTLPALVSVIEELLRTGNHKFELAPLEEP